MISFKINLIGLLVGVMFISIAYIVHKDTKVLLKAGIVTQGKVAAVTTIVKGGDENETYLLTFEYTDLKGNKQQAKTEAKISYKINEQDYIIYHSVYPEQIRIYGFSTLYLPQLVALAFGGTLVIFTGSFLWFRRKLYLKILFP